MSLITESRLRQIIRESLVLLEAETASARTAGAAAVTGAAGDIAKRAPSVDTQKVKLFIADVLDGRKIVTRSKTNTDDALMVGYFLSQYMRHHTDGSPASLEKFGALGTSYPEKQVKNAQKALGLQEDGDFGRQTMVALATGGRVKLDPTLLGKIKANPKARDAVSLRIAMGLVSGNAPTQDQIVKAAEGMAGTGESLPSLKPGSTGALADAPPPAMMPMAAGGKSTIGPGAQINVQRLPYNAKSYAGED